ncbi:MAG: dipeptide epimerase [Synergistaceae bacterium]|nr:dipeptide epimerase [Synergistaceae bacterium]
MKITGIRLGTLNIPLKKPFKTALRMTDTVSSNIVEMSTDEGVCGYGEAPPTAAITGDTDGSIRCAISTRIAPALTGRDVSELNDVLFVLDHCIVGNNSGKAAVDIALHDLWGKLYKQPLYKILGGAHRKCITDYTISLNDPNEMVRDSLEAIKEGYEALKIKVGNNFRLDMERIEAIRDAVGENVLLRVDANQGWKPKEAIRAIKFMEDKGLDIELVEQPVVYHDIEGLKYVTDAVDTIILADESVYSPRDAMKLIGFRAADMINIKLMKSGGIGGALKICAMAEAAGMDCMIGAMMESKVAITAATHLAMARRCITKYDLDPPILCASDPVEGGVVYKGALLELSDAPGLGIASITGVEWKI